jgi:nucleoid-associated protein YgaU
MAEKTAEQAPERAALKWIGGAVVGLILGGTALYYLAGPDAPSAPEETATTPESAESESTEPADVTEPAVPAVVTEATEPADVTEATEPADVTEATEPADVTKAAEPAEATESAEPADETDAAEADPAPEPEPAPATEAMPAPVAPAFDTVRVDADGSVLVAGRAGADARVSILVDDAEAAEATADGKGSFAALFTLDPSDAPRVMTLIATAPDGAKVPSEQSVLIGPIAAPDVVAAAEPVADPETASEPEAATESADGMNVSAEPDVTADAPETGETTPVVTAEVAPTAPEILIIDNDGVRRQTAAVSVTDIVIDTIGYGATGDVEIAGRGTAGQFVRIYLDNADTAAVGIGADGGWAAVLTDVAAGRYTLRVDQMDGTGKVTSRFETPFQREAPDDVLAALQPEVSAPEPAETAADTMSSDTASEVSATAPETPDTSAPEVAKAPAPDASPEAGTSDPTADVATEGSTTAIAAAPAEDTPPKPATRAAIVTVQPGFTLWRIARENYGDGLLYVKVYEANKDQIRDPDLIYPGQIFKVPDPGE